MSIFDTHTFAFVDVETSPSRVIEVGILRVEGGEIVETFNSLVNPRRIIHPFVTALTGIRQEDVISAPHFEDIAQDVYRLLDGAIFVAHSAPFDYSFITKEMAGAGFSWGAPKICTARLSRALFPEFRHHNLSVLIERYGLSCKNRHRAFDDAHTLWQFLQRIEAMGKGTALKKAIKKQLTPKSTKISVDPLVSELFIEEPIIV